MDLSSFHPAFASPINLTKPINNDGGGSVYDRPSSRTSKSSLPIASASASSSVLTDVFRGEGEVIEMASLGERAVEEAEQGSVAASVEGESGEVDSQGRRPIVLGGKEEHLALGSLFFVMFLGGWNDATIGPLLLPMREFYSISLTIVSLTFVFNFIGFLLAAVLNVWLTDRFGFGKVMILAGGLQIATYAIQTAAPPFPVFCFSFVLSGTAMGLQDAQANAFVARLPNMLVKMSIMHAIYGLGAMVCPLVSTQFSKIPQWHFHYFTSLGFAALSLLVVTFVFRGRTDNSILGVPADEQLANENGEVSDAASKMKDIMKRKAVHTFAAFTLFYVGLEVTIGGWMVTYLIEVRGGTANSGYISTGFFGGLTLGRLIFIELNRRLGERRAVYFYTICSFALEFMVWWVPSLIGSAVAVSFVGLFLGPIYPIIMSVVSKVLPRSLQGGAIGWISCFGQGGSALFPFVTGVLASKHGVEVMPPVVVAMLGGLFILWFFTPKVDRRDE